MNNDHNEPHHRHHRHHHHPRSRRASMPSNSNRLGSFKTNLIIFNINIDHYRLFSFSSSFFFLNLSYSSFYFKLSLQKFLESISID
jgi:hypothetical protein